MPDYEVLIPCAPKDYTKLDYCIRAAMQHTNASAIRVVTPTPVDKVLGAHYYLDDEIMDIERRDMGNRTGWYYSSWVKLFNPVVATDYYIAIDSDTILVKDIDPFSDNVPHLYTLGGSAHKPYSCFNEKILGYSVPEFSFVCEVVLYSKTIIGAMLGGLSPAKFASMIYDTIEDCAKDNGPKCLMGDSQMYGDFVYHNTDYRIKTLNRALAGKYSLQEYTTKEIEQLISSYSGDADYLTAHTWI